jgi:hypothetical protein
MEKLYLLDQFLDVSGKAGTDESLVPESGIVGVEAVVT